MSEAPGQRAVRAPRRRRSRARVGGRRVELLRARSRGVRVRSTKVRGGVARRRPGSDRCVQVRTGRRRWGSRRSVTYGDRVAPPSAWNSSRSSVTRSIVTAAVHDVVAALPSTRSPPPHGVHTSSRRRAAERRVGPVDARICTTYGKPRWLSQTSCPTLDLTSKIVRQRVADPVGRVARHSCAGRADARPCRRPPPP